MLLLQTGENQGDPYTDDLSCFTGWRIRIERSPSDFSSIWSRWHSGRHATQALHFENSTYDPHKIK